MAKSIIDGVDGIIDEGLNLSNIGGDPQYQHGQSCSKAKQGGKFDANEVVSRIYEQLVTNLKDPDNRIAPKVPFKSPFEINWRLKKHTTLPDPNSDIDQTEKEIERAIVNLSDSANFRASDWANQVPTSLELISSQSDQGRKVDLVHRLGEGVYEFIELKVEGGDTPMSAAFQIVINGLIYLVLRESYKEQYDTSSEETIKAKKVHLQTLAPQKYYSNTLSWRGEDLSWLENELNKGLKAFVSGKFNNNFKIDFTFTSFPESFDWPCKNNNELVEALNNRISVYPKRITDGVDKIIDEGLNLFNIGTAPHFKHKKSCLITKKTPVTFDANKVVSRIYEQLVANLKNPDNEFHSVGPSKENWRFEKKPKMPNDNSKSKREEMKLEKTIVKFPDWVNQVPTSFRLIAPHSDIKRNIDLVHRLGIGKGAYEFIELKVGSDTPMDAAFQIVVSGLIYLMSREFYTKQYIKNKEILKGIDSQEILKARKVHLQTLAPHGYYSDYSLEWLENELNKGLKAFVSGKFNNIEIDFTFTSFPESFVWPCEDNELVEALENRISVKWRN